MGRCERFRQQGLTLVELVVSIVVIGVALAGVLLAVDQAIRPSADPLLQHQALAIAEAYLDEILTKRFSTAADSGPETGETRAVYDDVSDYNGLAEAPRDQFGNAIAELNAYAVAVTVSYLANAMGGTPGKRITVSVAHQDLRCPDPQTGQPVACPVTLAGFRTDYP
ncbi:MAG: type II secretion system GspH family protein [Pseudomonadota bacterium]|nr:type II secretion system GspH family protein [Pseudomonadota bacterium]